MSQVVQERNLACCMTIHQPSWSIFIKLDRVILLAKGGVYYDGKPRDTVEYFESLGYGVPEGMNPADYFISITENPSESDERSRVVEELTGHWDQRRKREAASSELTITANAEMKRQEVVRTRWPTPWPAELSLLFTRMSRESVSGTLDSADDSCETSRRSSRLLDRLSFCSL